ncbi:phage baseplate protein [Empedobacter brevis]
MNKIDFQQTGGFPLETDTLDAMQTAYNIFNSLGNIIAPLAIISGCEQIGNQISNGIVYINGEVIEFRGGTPTQFVIIGEDVKNRLFYEETKEKPVYRTRYATFGESAGNKNYRWSDFHRPFSLKEIGNRLVHPGFIQDYYGDINKIPYGWVLCDGANGTPDLRGMFVVGYDNRDTEYNAIGKTGGTKEVALNVNQMPLHKHNGFTAAVGDHQHFVAGGSYVDDGKNDGVDQYNTLHVRGDQQGNGHRYQLHGTNLSATLGKTSTSGSHSHTFETNETGGNQAHENRPPFYVLAKIMYKG